MTSQQWIKLKLPSKPGVYIFRDKQNRPLYIGRATSLRDRTKSYFSKDLIETRGPRIVDMVFKAKNITWQTTPSVLEAIFLENLEIKKYQPYYNVDLKDDKSSQYIVITDEDMPRIFLMRVRDFEYEKANETLEFPIKKVFGPYNEGGLIKEALKIIRKIFPFRDLKSNDIRHDSFYREINWSPETDDGSYKKTVSNLLMIFEGKTDLLKKRLEREMNDFAKNEMFEKAAIIRKQIFALNHINDIALIREQNSKVKKSLRIEAYDIAHLSGKDVVGAMVVSEDGKLSKNEYRKFKLKNDTNDDLRNLAEVIDRRLNHTEWTYPDLIIVDGGENQKKVIETVLSSRRIGIPVVAVKKNDKHKAEEVLGDRELISKYKKEIVALNAECHRFAIAFHRQRRTKSFGQNM